MAEQQTKAKPLELLPGQARTLAYGENLRTDYRLLECDEALLEQVLAGG